MSPQPSAPANMSGLNRQSGSRQMEFVLFHSGCSSFLGRKLDRCTTRGEFRVRTGTRSNPK
jgi:hypothetical protein